MVSPTVFMSRGMAPGLAREFAAQINAGSADTRALLSRGMSAVLAEYVAGLISGATDATLAGLTSLGVQPNLAMAMLEGLNAPSNTAAPSISGTTTVGEALTSTPGTWSGETPFTYARRWFRDGDVISGATSASYTLVADDEGATITVEVTATNDYGSASKTSAGVGPVAAA